MRSLQFYDVNTLVLDKVFINSDNDNQYIDYAIKHNFNFLYTEPRNSDTILLIDKFINNGYKLETVKIKWPSSLLKFETKLCIKLIRIEKHSKFDKNKERQIITEVLNYLLCLSRLVQPGVAKHHYGFDFDGAIIDLFTKIKNEYNYEKLNVNKVINNDLYKQIVNELDRVHQ